VGSVMVSKTVAKYALQWYLDVSCDEYQSIDIHLKKVILLQTYRRNKASRDIVLRYGWDADGDVDGRGR
jgi:hypothetical protein